MSEYIERKAAGKAVLTAAVLDGGHTRIWAKAENAVHLEPAADVAPAAQYPFTQCEREILQALRHVKSMSLEAVARNLYMSRNTVLYHVDKMKRMTGHDPRTFEGLAACLEMMGEERYGH